MKAHFAEKVKWIKVVGLSLAPTQMLMVARTRAPCLPLLLAPAGAAASAAAAGAPTALQPCFWLARRPGRCSNHLARCARE